MNKKVKTPKKWFVIDGMGNIDYLDKKKDARDRAAQYLRGAIAIMQRPVPESQEINVNKIIWGRVRGYAKSDNGLSSNATLMLFSKKKPIRRDTIGTQTVAAIRDTLKPGRIAKFDEPEQECDEPEQEIEEYEEYRMVHLAQVKEYCEFWYDGIRCVRQSSTRDGLLEAVQYHATGSLLSFWHSQTFVRVNIKNIK